MKTYPVLHHNNTLTAFEIENVYISVNKIAMLLRSAHDVADVRVRKLFSPVEDIHIEFKYMGTECAVLEPFGDNSRYWIGPKDSKQAQIDIKALERIFQEYQPHLLRKVIGDLISFKFFQKPHH